MKAMSLINTFKRKNRALLRELVVTDFKLRYQGSALGYMWSLLKPLLLFAILYVVFGVYLKFGSDIPHFPIYLLLGIVLWAFFTEATTQGLQAIVNRGDLIRKVNFPKYIIVISGTVSALINLVLNLLVVLVFLLVSGVDLGYQALWFPLIVLQLYVFALALAFFLGALYVKFRDISHIWEVGLQAAFYATPILYPITEVIKHSELVAKLMLLNPLAQIIQDARYALVSKETVTLYDLNSGWYVLVPFAIVLVTAVVASWYFKRNAGRFAENI